MKIVFFVNAKCYDGLVTNVKITMNKGKQLNYITWSLFQKKKRHNFIAKNTLKHNSVAC